MDDNVWETREPGLLLQHYMGGLGTEALVGATQKESVDGFRNDGSWLKPRA